MLNKLLGIGVGPAVSAVEGVANIIDRFVETEDERRGAEEFKMRMAQQPMALQAEINKIQAAHRTVFVAGPRPFIMWVCGFSLALNFGLIPIVEVLLAIFLPANAVIFASMMNGSVMINFIQKGETLTTMLFAILGLGAYRTYEKRVGVAK